MLRKILISILIVFLGAIAYIFMAYYPQLPIANGYAAKKMCSCAFIADRSPDDIQRTDLGFGPLSMTKSKIDPESGSVTTNIFGMAARTAVYREGVGCILLNGGDDHNVSLSIEPDNRDSNLPWPLGKSVSIPGQVDQVDLDGLNTAIDEAFDPGTLMIKKKTRAVVVVYKGKIIAEKYADGFDANTEILGWSMTKSIISTLIGILQKNGKANLNDKGLFPEWVDYRKDISIKDLLQMQSGLGFSEVYEKISDATRMLFISEDISEIPLQSPLEHDPGEYWYYKPIVKMDQGPI